MTNQLRNCSGSRVFGGCLLDLGAEDRVPRHDDPCRREQPFLAHIGMDRYVKDRVFRIEHFDISFLFDFLIYLKFCETLSQNTFCLNNCIKTL